MRSLAVGAAIALVLSAGTLHAQLLSGSLNIELPAPLEVSFECARVPVCTGTYRASARRAGCSNTFVLIDDFEMTGLDPAIQLGRPGPIQGDIKLANLDFNTTPNVDGTCSFGAISDLRGTYAGAYQIQRASFTASLVDMAGNRLRAQGTFTGGGAAAPPTSARASLSEVRASIDARVANASAHLSFRLPDLGSAVNVYVFAFAPRILVQGVAGGSQNHPACVLAQLDPVTGQLVAVSAVNLQAYVATVANAEGQAVRILANIPTAQIEGTSFFVGYGPDGNTMISGAASAHAVTAPGSPQCPDVFPAVPGPLSGLWWNANEPGWGVHLTQRRNVLFAAWYTYDAAGSPKWHVASSCALPAGTSGAAGSCDGVLYEVTGPRFFGAPFIPSAVSASPAGNLRLDFQGADSGSMTYVVTGQSRTVPITRQPIAAGATRPMIDYTDLWWNRFESGWGLAIAQQYDTMFLAWYVYDNAGRPVWYVASNCAVASGGNGCSGPLYRTTGPPFGPAFDPSRVQVFAVGTVAVSFIDANNGRLSYTVNGVTASKLITRQLF